MNETRDTKEGYDMSIETAIQIERETSEGKTPLAVKSHYTLMNGDDLMTKAVELGIPLGYTCNPNSNYYKESLAEEILKVLIKG